MFMKTIKWQNAVLNLVFPPLEGWKSKDQMFDQL